MVSLAKTQTSFSNPELNQEDEDVNNEDIIETELEDQLLASADDGRNPVFQFKSVKTVSSSVFQIVVSIGMLIISAVLPYECKHDSCAVKPLSVLLYLHCLYWGIFLICDQYIQYEHIKVRRRGYLEFYNDTRTLSQMPFWVVSTWSTLLLTISTILNDRCSKDADTCDNVVRLSKADYVTVFIGLEFLVLLSVLVIYFHKVWKFNQRKDPPDVLRDDLMNSSTIDFGSKGLGPIDDEIFERQADLIRYYKDHNSMLQRKVLELQYQITGRTPNLA